MGIFWAGIRVYSSWQREELRKHTVKIVATLYHDNMSDSTGRHRIELRSVLDWRTINFLPNVIQQDIHYIARKKFQLFCNVYNILFFKKIIKKIIKQDIVTSIKKASVNQAKSIFRWNMYRNIYPYISTTIKGE